MAKKANKRSFSLPSAGHGDASPSGRAAGSRCLGLPETRTQILAQAAAGNWGPFLEQYLEPCWREVVIVCRSRQVPLPDADDLFQELMLRLLSDAGFNRRVRSVLARQKQDPDFHGNMAGRYLKYRELPLRSARFRTYLKRVILNLVREAARKAHRRPKQLDDQAWKAIEPWMEQSVTRSLDRQWATGCLAEAAWQLWATSYAAPTRGRRRLFDILYLSTVRRQRPETIARKHGITRTTVSGLLTEARGRFVFLLSRITGITDRQELKELLADSIDELRGALARVRADAPT